MHLHLITPHGLNSLRLHTNKIEVFSSISTTWLGTRHNTSLATTIHCHIHSLSLSTLSQIQCILRFSGAQHHCFLLEFLQSVAGRYRQDRRAGDLVVDLLKLKVPKLFAVEGGREEDEAVAHEFSAFLRTYILRCNLKYTILAKLMDIMVRELNSHTQMSESHEDHITQPIMYYSPPLSGCNLRPV